MKIFTKIKHFLLTLLLGQVHSQPKGAVRPAITNHYSNLKCIWDNKKYKDFGLERLIRLTLALLIFVFPGLYIRDLFGKFGLLGRKLAVDFYVLIKLFLPIAFFGFNLTNYALVATVAGVMAVETILYLATLIFLSDEFAKPISYRRSLTALFINYIEVCLDYAVVYSYCNHAIPCFFKEKLTTNIQAIYFSFATSATVGYGDIIVINSFGQYLVISQIILFLVFVALFINFFASKIQEPTYYNMAGRRHNKWKKSMYKSNNSKRRKS